MSTYILHFFMGANKHQLTFNFNLKFTMSKASDDSDNNNMLEMCANCGRGEEESCHLKKCNGCKMVRYCSKDCQAAHRPRHKRECKKRAAELHEEALFDDPPQPEDCPVCFLCCHICIQGEKLPIMLWEDVVHGVHSCTRI